MSSTEAVNGLQYAKTFKQASTPQSSRAVSFGLTYHNRVSIIPTGMMDAGKIGALVREERKAQGLRQVELAAASGVGVRFLAELEAGKPTAQIGKALAVLAALGCHVEIVRPGNAEAV